MEKQKTIFLYWPTGTFFNNVKFIFNLGD